MKRSEYIKLSSKDLKMLIKKKKREIKVLEDYCFDVEQKEHEQKYKLVKVKGCKGCPLENTIWNNTCDHCDGYHYKNKLKV